MSEFDFSQLQSLQTPDAWIETALHIPQQCRKPRPFFLRPSFIATAVSLVIVAAVVLTLLLHANGTKPPRLSVPALSTTPVTTAAQTTQPPADSTAATHPTGAAAADTTANTQQDASTARTAATAVSTATAASSTAPQPAATAATTAATVPTKAATTAATSPTAAQTTTQAATVPMTHTTEVIPAFEIDWFEGSIAVLFTPGSPFSGKEMAYLRFDSPDGFCGIVSVTPPNEPYGYENVTEVNPTHSGVFIPSGKSCTVTVYDRAGNRKELQVVFPLTGTVTIKL